MVGCAEEFGGFGSFDVFYFLVIEEADGGDSPDDPGAVVLLHHVVNLISNEHCIRYRRVNDIPPSS